LESSAGLTELPNNQKQLNLAEDSYCDHRIQVAGIIHSDVNKDLAPKPKDLVPEATDPQQA